MTEKIDPRGIPITDDDASIANALEDVSIPTLLLSMVHMTGDTSILEGPLRPMGVFLNEVQGFMPEEDKAAVREQALEIIKAYRDGGCQLPPPPTGETLRKMMSFLVAQDVPQEYVPMMLEEMELDGEDQREFHWEKNVSGEAKLAFHVVVIGCGEAGLVAAIRLKEAGIPYTVIEKNPSVGGTWYENHYPGCRVDVGNHFYCYSFEPNPDWTEYFSRQPELLRYFQTVMEKYGVRDHIRFETEVTAAHFEEATATWKVHLRNPDGSEETIDANAVVSAVGQLNRPKLPDIEGIDTFEGPSMHSAQWQDGTQLAGKRIAVVGTGASAFQIVPTIAEEAEHLVVFQRSAPWMFSNPNYHKQVGAGTKWALKHLPYYARWYRFLLFWPGCDGGMEAMRLDPEWEHLDRSTCALNEAARITFTQYMKEQIGDDEELFAKVVPDYVCLGKRTLQDNGSWLSSLTRDDVDLITDPIARITKDGIQCQSGAFHPVDVIIYATGFQANKFLWPMEITGIGGEKLRDRWGDDPAAYLGITVPDFPNLFCIYGPGTNLAHGGSLIFHSECQTRYIMGCLKLLIEGGHSTMACKPDVHDAYDARLQKELEGMVWSHPSIESSWYKNESGRVTVLSPWRLVDYWSWTKEPDPADYVIA
jgi:4-hydroxyacetophenone monooxygenase